MERKCLGCGDVIRGRVDKKFCSYSCRNSYNNKLYRDSTEYVRKVNRKLRKNRRILYDLYAQKKLKVHKDILSALGYDFSFLSHVVEKNGVVSHYCFEYGFDIVSDGYCELRYNDDIVD